MNKHSPLLRQGSLDILRIIACLMVVAIHTYAPVLNEGYQPTLRWWEANLINSFSRWAVPVFVMISGCFVLGAEGFMLGKRLLRLAVPLLFWSAIYLAVDHWFLQPISWQDIGEKMFSGEPHYHLYFLFAMLGLTVVTPLLRWFLARTLMPHQIILLLLLYALALLHKYQYEPNAVTFFIRFLPFYLLGYMLRDVRINLLLLAVGFVLSCISVAIFQEYAYLSPLCILSSVCAFLFARQTNLKKHWRYLRPLSDATLGIYLIHPLFLPHISLHVPLILAWLVTISVSAFSVLLLMKIPLIRKTVA